MKHRNKWEYPFRSALVMALLLAAFFWWPGCAVLYAIGSGRSSAGSAFAERAPIVADVRGEPAPASAEVPLVPLFNKVAGSVGALYARAPTGDMKFKCTVTLTERQQARSLLLTAGHCAERNESYRVTFDGKRFHAARVWMLPAEQIDPQIKRDYGEPKVDMAMFLVDERLPLEPIQIDETVPVEAGREIVTVGFPLGVTKISYVGIVAGRLDNPGADDHGYLLLQIFGAPGSSGSAVVDRQTGRIVGVLVAGRQGLSGLPVVYATPIGYRTYLQPAAGEK